MNLAGIGKSLSIIGSKTLFVLKKHAPEILISVGIIGVGASTVMACKATLKAPEKIEKSKQEVDRIHAMLANQTLIEDGVYSQKQGNKELAGVYWKTCKDMIKLYYPSAILGALSVASILGSHKIMTNRNADLVAACATLDNAFKTYRKNVIEKYGEEEDKNLRHSLKEKVVDKIVTDANGKEKTVKETEKEAEDDGLNDIRRLTWDENTTYAWNRNANYNYVHLKSASCEANDKFRAQGHLYVYELYDILEIKPDSGYYCKDAYKYGWVLRKGERVGDNFIDLGIDFNKLLESINADMNAGIIRQDGGYFLEFNIDPYPIVSNMDLPDHCVKTKGALVENGRIIVQTED